MLGSFSPSVSLFFLIFATQIGKYKSEIWIYLFSTLKDLDQALLDYLWMVDGIALTIKPEGIPVSANPQYLPGAALLT